MKLERELDDNSLNCHSNIDSEGMGLNVLKKRRFENECLSGISEINAKIARELENIFRCYI